MYLQAKYIVGDSDNEARLNEFLRDAGREPSR